LFDACFQQCLLIGIILAIVATIWASCLSCLHASAALNGFARVSDIGGMASGLAASRAIFPMDDLLLRCAVVFHRRQIAIAIRRVRLSAARDCDQPL